MTNSWSSYPINYRAREVQYILHATRAGECISVVGLSGSGKSNLLGFIANCLDLPPEDQKNTPQFCMVDCNRLGQPTLESFFRLLYRSLCPGLPAKTSSSKVEEPDLSDIVTLTGEILALSQKLCLLLDRFDALMSLADFPLIASNLRALRDDYKYQLTYVTASRLPVDSNTELAELFFAHTLWLGPLEKSDALWSARRDSLRFTSGEPWSYEIFDRLIALTGGYPSFLRAACEAYASSVPLDAEALSQYPAVRRRLDEFWADEPRPETLRLAGLEGHPLLQVSRPELHLSAHANQAGAAANEKPGSMAGIDQASLTAKEHLLLQYFLAHSNQVCEKDNLVRAVWSEDVIFSQGIRDESLAQLVRRLRTKIEPDPANPTYIQTVPGRGYLFRY